MAQADRNPNTRPSATTAVAIVAAVLLVGAFFWMSSGQGDSTGAATQAQAGQDTDARTTTPEAASGAVQDGESQGQPAEEASGHPAPLVPVVTAGELAANPTLYYGRPVSVHAEIEEVLDGRMFTLDEDRIGASPDVLVILPEPTDGAAPVAGSFVTVVGPVQPFVESRLMSAFDWFRPSSDVVIRLRARPVIVADSARMASGRALTPTPAVAPVLVTNPGRITEMPGRFYGQRVLVPDATVDALRSPRAFTLDDPAFLSDQDLLVVLPPASEPFDAIREDQVATVRGTVRRYVADQFARDYTWFDASDLGDIAVWENRPVLVADLLRPEGAPDVVLLDVAWTSPTRIDGEDWWVRRAWEPLPDADSRPPSTARAGPEPSPATGPAPIADIETFLTETDRRTFEGRNVSLDTVLVQRVVGDAIVLVGPAADRGIAVRVPEPAEAKPGTAVRVEGIVRSVPRSLDGWELDADERDALGSRQIFIDAVTVGPGDANRR